MSLLPLALSGLLAAAPKPSAPAKPVPAPSRGDTTTRPSAVLVLPDLRVEQVKAKITPRLMNRGWMMTQNRNDSMDFNRAGDSALVRGLFGIDPRPQDRVVLRFGVRAVPEGTQARLQALLLTPDSAGVLRRTPLPADSAVLRQSLETIRDEEFGPGALIPTLEGPRDRRKDKGRK